MDNIKGLKKGQWYSVNSRSRIGCPFKNNERVKILEVNGGGYSAYVESKKGARWVLFEDELIEITI